MAQIATITVETAGGPVDLPVYEPGDSGSNRLEAFRVQTASGPGFVPLAAVDEADRPYLRVQTSSGVRAVDTSASGIPDSQVQRSADDSINSRSDLLGPIFNPNVYISGLKAEISSNTSGVSTAYITDNNENVLGSTDISGLSSGDSFRLEDLTLSSGTKYYLLLDNNGSTFTAGFLDNAPIPYETDAFDITGQYGPDFGENTVSFPVVNNIRNLDF